jgi:hypothetical protein
MPKIFEYFGFIFYFYSNEHEPIHVHVIHGGRESIFDLIMMDGMLANISVREKKKKTKGRQRHSFANTTRTLLKNG